jgi:hypothetical protein
MVLKKQLQVVLIKEGMVQLGLDFLLPRGVSGSNRESLTEEHSGQYHASSTLKIYFFRFQEKSKSIIAATKD